MKIESPQHDAFMMGLVLTVMAACSALIGGLGIVNYMNGATLKAFGSLVVPAYICYWAWQVRGSMHSEPLIPAFAFAWVCGLPIGLIVHRVIS